MLKILIADDHIAVQLGLEILLRSTIRVESQFDFAKNGKEILEGIKSNTYDILVTDLNMPDTDTLALLPLLLQAQPNLKVIVVSVGSEAVFAKRCFQLGAYAYVPKSASDDEIKLAVQHILLGKKYISSSQAELFITEKRNVTNPFELLSARELDVAVLLLKGLGIIEIANNLKINPSTASTFKSRIFDKLHVKHMVDLVKLSRQFRLIEDVELI
jgi:two-component system, NarL family, invasion response regulator UvrY